MKDAIRLNTPQFNTARMLQDYALHGYFAVCDRSHSLSADKYSPARILAHWQSHLTQHWNYIKILEIVLSHDTELQVNDPCRSLPGFS
jgi:starch phosphorylase